MGVRLTGAGAYYRLPGIRFEAVPLTVESTAVKFPGRTLPGVRLVITDRQAYRPVRTALLLIDEIRRRTRETSRGADRSIASPVRTGSGS